MKRREEKRRQGRKEGNILKMGGRNKVGDDRREGMKEG